VFRPEERGREKGSKEMSKTNRPEFPTTSTDYSKDLPEHFMTGILFGEQGTIDEACNTCEWNNLRFETARLAPKDINLMVDMCRIDDYFSQCRDDRTDLAIDTLDVMLLAWHRVARLAHTFWGIQSHFASLGVEPNEDLSVDFVKRAVSELIKRENDAKGESAEFEMARATAMSNEQAE
jgi:hypothetical protein